MGDWASLLRHAFLQTEEDGSGMICTYLVILAIILIGLYIGLYLYNKLLVGKRAKQHPCRYCGHIVEAVSQCCNAPVEERFMGGRCSKCGKDCKTICARCKRPLF
jgi:hypothetical protein